MKLSATRHTLPIAALMTLVLATAAAAQTFATTACSPCAQPLAAQPTVAYSPVVAQPTVALSPVLSPAAAPQPVVFQTYRPVRPLFSGRILRRIFGFRNPAVVAPVAPVAPAPTFVTAAYAPTLAAPTAVFAPQVQTVARPVALATTTFRPVTLSPVVGCSPCCQTGCCPSCSPGVTQASFAAPGCPNCAGGGTTYTTPSFPQSAPAQTPSPTPTPANTLPGETPQPGLSPGAAVPEQRLRPLPSGSDLLDPNDIGPASPASPGAGSGTKSDAYWQPPQLFNPNGRTTARPTAPVWNAVYQQDGSASVVSGRVFRVGPEAAASPAPQASRANAGGWHSVRN